MKRACAATWSRCSAEPSTTSIASRNIPMSAWSGRPKATAAFFGGDADNFEYPRYCLDATLVRVYEDGKPAKIEHFLKWSPTARAMASSSSFSGNPGSTQRITTLAAVKKLRDDLHALHAELLLAHGDCPAAVHEPEPGASPPGERRLVRRAELAQGVSRACCKGCKRRSSYERKEADGTVATERIAGRPEAAALRRSLATHRRRGEGRPRSSASSPTFAIAIIRSPSTWC